MRTFEEIIENAEEKSEGRGIRDDTLTREQGNVINIHYVIMNSTLFKNSYILRAGDVIISLDQWSNNWTCMLIITPHRGYRDFIILMWITSNNIYTYMYIVRIDYYTM